MSMNHTNDLMKALNSDSHFMDTIWDRRQDTLIVQTDSDMEWMIWVHEPLSKDAKTDIGGSGDSTSDSVVSKNFITNNDS